MKHLLAFALTFVLGAAAAFGVRTALHKPYTDAPAASAPNEYKPMVANETGAAAQSHDHAKPTQAPAAQAKPRDHADKAKSAPVNTICSICGMDVDPELPTETYQGKTIGFGCAACPPKFRANPDKYGPYYLRSERVKR
jgi:YHS domain-containing protein